MTRRNRAIAWGLLVAANLLLCLLWAARPTPAQAAAEQAAAPAPATSDDLPMMPEEEMTALNKFCLRVFYPVLHPFFKRVNDLLLIIPNEAAGFCGVGLFVSAMIFVGLILKKDYVNRGRPYNSRWTDLRLWTVISMTPHVLVYFYFR